jgi:hypothetical protein
LSTKQEKSVVFHKNTPITGLLFANILCIFALSHSFLSALHHLDKYRIIDLDETVKGKDT